MGKNIENITMKNNAKCIYFSDELTDGVFDSDIQGRAEYKEYYNSIYCKISEVVHIEKDNEYDERLAFGLKKPRGGELCYLLAGEGMIRQFMADVVEYSLENPNPKSWMKPENMKGKLVEVFLSEDNKHIIGVSPKSSYYVIGPKVGAKKSDITPKSINERYEPGEVRDYMGQDLTNAIIDDELGRI